MSCELRKMNFVLSPHCRYELAYVSHSCGTTAYAIARSAKTPTAPAKHSLQVDSWFGSRGLRLSTINIPCATRNTSTRSTMIASTFQFSRLASSGMTIAMM